MPRAEVGSTKWQANKMKSKGLQRLRWYCQACERQMRDENGFKCHVQSESHVRQMMLIGEDPRKAINDFSQQFLKDFLQLLRTAHGEKKVNLNHFYQEYISNKEHIHMNSTKWPSLTEFGKYLGREGICRVSEDEKGNGLVVSWIDNSPEALRRQDAIRKKERQERGDEEREQRLIQEQVERARAEAKLAEEERDDAATALLRNEGEKIQLNFKPAAASKTASPPQQATSTSTTPADAQQQQSPPSDDPSLAAGAHPITPPTDTDTPAPSTAPAAKPAIKIGFSSTNKPKNVFSSKSNPLAGKKVVVKEAPKKMSEAERIMKEEIERKRARESGGGGDGKRRRVF